eukprot:3058175-Prorocentrum_lima.AAC.1
MTSSLVGSEMCIRDSLCGGHDVGGQAEHSGIHGCANADATPPDKGTGHYPHGHSWLNLPG